MGKINLFGDVRAEHDHEMLDTAFHESQNYRTLFESKDRFIVVGRRGTGKSALTYRLSKDWTARTFSTITIAPNEEQVFGIRPLAEQFGNSISRIRAGVKLAWKYALLLEIALICQKNYKFTNEVSKNPLLSQHLKNWVAQGKEPFERIRSTVRSRLNGIDNPEDRIADISSILEINRISEELAELTRSFKNNLVILIDRLDEGYEPDMVGIGIIDGIIYGTDEVRNILGDNFRAIVFLRDNIFRSIQSEDRDFSRNLESQVLRIHWSPEELFYMACKRIRFAYNLEQESDVKIWNAITSLELHGRDGFKRCLRLTLYRPRDVIALLNTAIEQARRQKREVLIEQDFRDSSKQISSTRLDDLGKEYESIFPGITQLTSAFANQSTQLSVSATVSIIKSVLSDPSIKTAALQHLTILGSEEEIIKALYGVGFLGGFDQQSNTWIFSHDGKRAEKNILANDLLMVHPCYWTALNIQQDNMEHEFAEQIYDEYEITIDSYSAEQRKSKLGQIIAELSKIPLGIEGASEFEEWCKRAIEIAFAKELTNVQLHANQDAVQRRDIVATNQGISGFWKRIRDDYSTRQIIFEVKNFEEIGIGEYRQMNGYLAREYGRMGFIICRDRQTGLIKGRELEAFKEFYYQEKVIIKITASTLTNILSKLRSPSKIDAGDTALGTILDTHIRCYSSASSSKGYKKQKK